MPQVCKDTDHAIMTKRVSFLPPMQIHKMHSFLDYIMGGCQIQFTVSCVLVHSYSGSWVVGTRRQKSIKALGQLWSSLIAEIWCGQICFKNKFILLFFPVTMVSSIMSGNPCCSTTGGLGNHPNASHSFSNYMRH